MSENHNIHKLIVEIIEDLDWGPVEKWNNYDFSQLSQLIFKATDTQLSSVTLKRVFGKVKYDSQPSTHTLNTLSQYRNYKDWRNFLAQCVDNLSPEPKPISNKNTSKKALYGIGFGILMTAIVIGVMSLKSTTLPKTNDFKFDSVKIGKDIPSSVIFRYDASKASAESQIEIQQNWDERRRTIVELTDSIHTSIYYYPGFFEAKLVVDDIVVQEKPIFIPSNGWITTVEQKPTPMYVSTSISKKENVLGISPDFLKENNFHPQSEPIYTNYSFVKKFPVFSDDFSFNAKLKNAALGGVNICQKMNIIILFEGEVMIIPLAQKGCVSNLNFYVPGNRMNGKTKDLSMFGIEGNEWIPVKINSNKDNFSISINDKIVKELPSINISKRLVGFRFIFEGTGWLKEVNLNEEVVL